MARLLSSPKVMYCEYNKVHHSFPFLLLFVLEEGSKGASQLLWSSTEGSIHSSSEPYTSLPARVANGSEKWLGFFPSFLLELDQVDQQLILYQN